MKQINWSFKAKLTFQSLLIVFLFSTTALVLNQRLIHEAQSQIQNSFVNYAQNIANAISAQFFERYGDVQAFAANPTIRSGSQEQIIESLNAFVALYGIYDLILFVDTHGRLIATNNKDAQGQNINVKELYKLDYSQASWFKATLLGQFTEDPQKGFAGTYFEDPNIDPYSSLVYGTKKYGNSFSTQVKDSKGRILGVISNRANFKWVETEFKNFYTVAKNFGLLSGELTLINKNGFVLVDYDPSSHNGNIEIQHDYEVLNKLNLTEKKVKAAEEILSGRTGSDIAVHARKKMEQIAGFTPIKGPKFIDSIGWGVIVRLSRQEVLAQLNSLQLWFYLGIGAISVLAILICLFFSKKILQHIQTTIHLLSQTTNQTNLTIRNATKVSQQLTDNANEQASAIQETAASIEEISAMANKNTENASFCQTISSDSRKAADNGKEAVNQMAVAMKQISESNNKIMSQVEEGNKQIAEIVKVIAEIGNKTKVINDIVFQTKLLSFNASVEAARAGEHGKGFAVVAEEVGNLAQMSGSAAKEISSMLSSGIQKVEEIIEQTNKKVEKLIVEGREAITHGLEVVDRCQKEIENILKFSSEVDQKIKEISAASTEQSQGIKEINEAIIRTNGVTQNIQEASQTSKSNAETLNQQIVQLTKAIEGLTVLFYGGRQNSNLVQKMQTSHPDNVVSLSEKKLAQKNPPIKSDAVAQVPLTAQAPVAKPLATTTEAKASSLSLGEGIPSEDDPRFKEI